MSCCILTARATKAFRWTIAGLSVLGFVFSSVAVGHCDFLSVKVDDEYDDVSLKESFGLFSFQVSEEDGKEPRCIRYFDQQRDSLDTAISVARAFGIIAALFSGLNMLLVFAQLLVLMTTKAKFLWNTMRVLFVLCLVTQCLTFVFFGTDGCKKTSSAAEVFSYDVGSYTEEVLNERFELSCTPGVAAIMSVLATVFFAVAAVFSWIIPHPSQPVFNVTLNDPVEEKDVSAITYDQDGGRVSSRQATTGPLEEQFAPEDLDLSHDDEEASRKVTVTYGKNGEKIIEEEVLHQDGSKSITTTTVEPIETGLARGTEPPRKPSHRKPYASGSNAGRYGE